MSDRRESNEIRCPLSGKAVFMDPAALAAEAPMELYCPECGRLHIWDPARNRLTDPDDPTPQISN